jgi:hypothetical protein
MAEVGHHKVLHFDVGFGLIRQCYCFTQLFSPCPAEGFEPLTLG